MSTGIITSDIFKKHDTEILGSHSENPKRLESILSFLKDKEVWKKVEKISTRKILPEELYTVHTPDYVASVLEFCKNGGGWLDNDTVACPESYEVALIAAGSVLEAIDIVMTDQLKKVFCFVRPPGHHALPDTSMGFCLFSNLSLGAVYALSKYNLERILVLDWDAHHGNGTEKIFYNSNKVFTVSWHQYPFWPFSGNYTDTGSGEGAGYNMNIPVPEGFTDEVFIETFEKLVVPAARKFKPQLIMLAAGYDAHWKDHLAGLNATNQGYQHLSRRVMELADELCQGKVVATLEGGYNLEALAEGVYSTLNFMQYPDYNLTENFSREKDNNKPKIVELINNIINVQTLLK
jgi:acetoin utilization deacetylase AcuC-like enzyme